MITILLPTTTRMIASHGMTLSWKIVWPMTAAVEDAKNCWPICTVAANTSHCAVNHCRG